MSECVSSNLLSQDDEEEECVCILDELFLHRGTDSTLEVGPSPFFLQLHSFSFTFLISLIELVAHFIHSHYSLRSVVSYVLSHLIRCTTAAADVYYNPSDSDSCSGVMPAFLVFVPSLFTFTFMSHYYFTRIEYLLCVNVDAVLLH